MVQRALINKEVLPYICSRKKVSIDYLQSKTKVPVSRLKQWLDPEDPLLPTINQAKELAKCLHIPFASLYMNTKDIKVKEIPSIRNYRSFSGDTSIDDSSLFISLCDVLSERTFLQEEGIKYNLFIPKYSSPTVLSDSPREWAETIRNYYLIDLSEQYRLKSSRQLYLYLRDKLEQKGIFVQCFTDVPLEVARGFAIYDREKPVIGINDNDRPPAKAFSLIHELVHLIKRESSVCTDMLRNSTLKEETFCNAVAGELLVPADALAEILESENHRHPYTIDTLKKISDRFSVSREVIVRRMLDYGYISKPEYEEYIDKFNEEIARERELQRQERQAGRKTGIPRNIGRETIDRISPSISRVLLYGLMEEKYSKREIAQHLHIAQKHVDKYIEEVSRWNN